MNRSDYTHAAVFGFFLLLLGFVFMAYTIEKWHREHPLIEAHIPNAYEEIQTPPTPPGYTPVIYKHDVKG